MFTEVWQNFLVMNRVSGPMYVKRAHFLWVSGVWFGFRGAEVEVFGGFVAIVV
jgi:hypothetical protein